MPDEGPPSRTGRDLPSSDGTEDGEVSTELVSNFLSYWQLMLNFGSNCFPAFRFSMSWVDTRNRAPRKVSFMVSLFLSLLSLSAGVMPTLFVWCQLYRENCPILRFYAWILPQFTLI